MSESADLEQIYFNAKKYRSEMLNSFPITPSTPIIIECLTCGKTHLLSDTTTVVTIPCDCGMILNITPLINRLYQFSKNQTLINTKDQNWFDTLDSEDRQTTLRVSQLANELTDPLEHCIKSLIALLNNR
jgi:hypothetical protein